MKRMIYGLSAGLLAVALAPAVALGQFPSELVSFEDLPSGAADNEEMFWEPEFSGTTTMYITTNGGPSDRTYNGAFRNPNVNFATDGFQSLDVFWAWVDQNDPDAWVRLTTANHPIRPNPSLDLRGKVRFDITNWGDLTGGEIGIVLGIRETGVNVPQLANGGADAGATIEWVGVDPTINAVIAGSNGIAETAAAGDDVQLIEVGSTGLSPQAVVIDPGPNGVINTTPAGDDENRAGYYTTETGARVPIPAVTLPVNLFPYAVEFNLATGDVTVDGITTDGGIAGFTGDGVLDAPNFRGTLDHIGITNVVTDPPTDPSPATRDVVFGIDSLQFEATVIDPLLPPVIQGPVFDSHTEVVVLTSQGSNLARLIIDGSSNGIPEVAPVDGVATFSGLTLSVGQILTARQRRGAEWSGPSSPVAVTPAGLLLAEDFDSYASRDEMDDLWLDSVTTGEGGQVELESGSAASCPNYVVQANTTSGNVSHSRLYRYLGDVNGTDAEPLWATWYFRHTSDNANARVRFELARFDSGEWSAGARSNGTTGFAITNGVAGALQTEYGIALRTSAPETSGTNGFVLDYSGYQIAPTGVPRTSNVWHKMQIEVRDTVINYYIDDELVNPAAFPGGVPRPNNLPFQFIILGVEFTNNGPRYLWDNISVTKGATALPFGPPVPSAPTISGSILPGATTVTLSDVSTNATEVSVWEDGELKGNVTTTGFASTTVVVPVTPMTLNAAAMARQVIGGVESCDSLPRIVGTPPAAPVVNRPLEANNTSVLVGSIDATADLIKVYANSSTLIGQLAITPGTASVSVPVDPLVHLDQITATSSNASGESVHSGSLEVGKGNGDIYVTIGVRETGPGSGTPVVGGNGGVANGIEWVGASTTVTGAPVGKPLSPSNSWQTVTFDPATDPILAFAGGTANGVIQGQWGVLENLAITVNPSAGRSVGTYHVYVDNIRNIIGGVPTPVGNFDDYAAGTNEVMFRAPSFSGSTGGNLHTPSGNISRITAAQGNPGKSVEFVFYFVDSGGNRWVRLTTSNTPTLPNPFIRIDQPLAMDILLIEDVPPAAPAVRSPVEAGDTTVTVTGVLPESTDVYVYANDVQIGTAPVTTTNGIVEVPVMPLVHLTSITAKQFAPAGGFSSASTALEVGKGNGDVLLSLLIRESGDTGPIGSQAVNTTVGDFEFIGATTNGLGGAPQGIPVSPMNGWQTVTFDPAIAAPFGGLGDGVITETRGFIDALAIAVNASSPNRSSGAYRVFIDNVVNVGAGDITGFEGYNLGAEVLFQEPTFSGSTDPNLSFPPSASANSDIYNNGGERSQLLTWFFRDTAENRWVRITSSLVANVRNPVIDLTKPVQMDVLLLEGCPTVPGDMDGNCVRNDADVTPFLQCVSGILESAGPACVCADFDGDGRVDLGDYAEFQAALLDVVEACN